MILFSYFSAIKDGSTVHLVKGASQAAQQAAAQPPAQTTQAQTQSNPATPSNNNPFGSFGGFGGDHSSFFIFFCRHHDVTVPQERLSFSFLLADMRRSWRFGRKCRRYESDATTTTSESTDDAGDDELSHDAGTLEQPRVVTFYDHQ